MSTSYGVQIISPEEKELLFKQYEGRFLYTSKADVYGCCVKLLTKNRQLHNKWEDNFYAMSEGIRSHGRIIVMEENGEPLAVKYDAYTKTAFLTNVDYYGWVKSIALAIASDVLEDEHRIFGVHGAAIDLGCTGVSIIGPPGTGKTTHSWGLLRLPNSRLVSDDWYFVRLSGREPLAFGSEKNCYVDADIGKIWNEYERLVDKLTVDEKGRAVVNVRWIVGTGGVIPMTTMKKIVLLKREKDDKQIVTPMDSEQALNYLTDHDFCNPHQLVRNGRKLELRREFFRQYFQQTEVFLVNTIGTPAETQAEIRKALQIED